MSDFRTDRRKQLVAAMWIGAVGVVVTALVGMFGPHAASVWRLPRELDVRVERALVGAGYYRLDAEMRGQRAILTGTVDSRNALAAAQRTAIGAAGSGGLWAGGVTRVDVDQVQVRAPRAQPEDEGAEP